MKQSSKTKKNSPIDKKQLYRPWHNAFVFILKEFLPRDIFEIKTDISVGELPLSIDIIVLKRKNIVPTNVEIPSFFRSFLDYDYTIIEYKSPEVYFNFYDYLKLISYANMYRTKKRIYASSRVSIVGICSRTEKSFEEKMKSDSYVLNKLEDGFYRIDKKLYDSYLIKLDELELVDREMILAYFVRNSRRKEHYVSNLLRGDSVIDVELYLLRLLKYFEEVSMRTIYQGKTQEELKKDLKRAIIESGILREIRPEKVLRNYKPEDRLTGLKPDEIKEYLRKIEND